MKNDDKAENVKFNSEMFASKKADSNKRKYDEKRNRSAFYKTFMSYITFR